MFSPVCSRAARRAAVALALATLYLPTVVSATDLAWTSTRISGTMASGKRTSEGQAVFSNGDKADISTVCLSGPRDDKGWATSTCEADFHFVDGSRILMNYSSRHDEKTLEAIATGAFKGGKGRFEGMTGNATGTGLTGRMNWTASYTLNDKLKTAK
jgi:hypothetical protein